jgi:hypothetical protein
MFYYYCMCHYTIFINVPLLASKNRDCFMRVGYASSQPVPDYTGSVSTFYVCACACVGLVIMHATIFWKCQYTFVYGALKKVICFPE